MKRLLYILLLTQIIFINNACQKTEVPDTKPEVEAYLTAMMLNMEKYSINRKTINWENFRQSVMAIAEGSQSIDDLKTRQAIQMALTLLLDSHSGYLSAKGGYITGTGTLKCSNVTPVIPSADKEVGYVKVGTFSESSLSSEATNYAQAIQNVIKSSDNESIRGWIVDLRDNRGGNMWPMLAGIGPILGEGTAGYFIDPDNLMYEWGYKNGVADGFKLTAPYVLKKQNPRVAVLIDEATASSGEAIAIAFKARPDTKFFGWSTCGLSTANQSFNLSDGAILNLTTSTMADRNKNKYGKKVAPEMEDINQTRYLEQAIQWLKQ